MALGQSRHKLGAGGIHDGFFEFRGRAFWWSEAKKFWKFAHHVESEVGTFETFRCSIDYLKESEEARRRASVEAL